MARVNFETSVYKESGFQRLIEKLGSRILAKGWLIELWTIGQEFYEDNRKPISNEAWTENEFPEILLSTGFAKKVEHGYEVKGAKNAFEWIHELKDSASKAGKASAAARLEKYGSAQPCKITERPSNDRSEPVRTAFEDSRTAPNALERSLLLTPYSSLSSLRTLEPKGVSKEPPKIKSEVAYFIGAYVNAFQVRYPNVRPDLRGKVQGQIKTLLKDYPVDRAIELVQAYCQMDGHRDWFKTKGHDFGTFIENLNPISIALESGDTTGFDWSKVFKGDELKVIAGGK